MKTKARKIGIVNHKTLIVTVDIGKKIQHGYFRSPTGREVKPFAFYNSRKSFEQFWARILQFKAQEHLVDIVIGFESSGPYAEPLFHFLMNRPVRMVQINPLHTKRLKELTGNSPNKTDRKDPRVIADVISLGHALTLVVPQGPAAELRRLTQARERAIKTRTAIVNRLEHLIFVIFPEFTTVMKTLTSKSALCVLKNCPSPDSIARVGLESLVILLKEASQGRVGRHRAERLFAAAKNSIGIAEGKQSMVVEIKHLVSTIEHQNRFIDILEEQMASYLGQIPCSRNILSIRGIGLVIASGLIGEIGDFGAFKTIPEIMKLAGLDLYEISSGRHKGQRHISKRGRSLLRKLLFFGAINVVRSDGIMHTPYKRMLDRGMPKTKALVAICRKLLAVIFALVRDDTEYAADYAQGAHIKLAA
jgi:transposase